MASVSASSMEPRATFDAHCHIQYNPDKARAFLSTSPNYKCGLMGTRPQDWADVMELFTSFPNQIRPGLGLHPWFAHAPCHPDWLHSMTTQLEANPSMIVGEIGLDRLWVPPGSDKNEINCQRTVFEAQLCLATALRRPVSLHCVKADGMMLDILRSQPELPPALYFHSYGGSVETLRALCRTKGLGDRCFFGFSAAVNLRSPKTAKVVAAVPEERLLLESDLEAPAGLEDDLRKMAESLAAWRGWTVDQTLAITARNARRFYAMNEGGDVVEEEGG